MLKPFPPDAVLVRQTLGGRRDRFEELVRRHLPAVYAIALARLGRPPDAEDVAQETFLRAYEKLDTLREPGKFRSWTLTIARRIATDLGTRLARETTGRAGASEAVSQDDPVRREQTEVLRRALDRLDPDKREVLLLHYFAGDSARDIAKALGISRAAVLKRLQRAREQLGEAMVTEVRGAVAPGRPLADQVKEIAKLVAASGPAWALSAKASTSSALTLGALLPKGSTLIVAVLGGILALGGTALLLRDSEQAPVTAVGNRPADVQPSFQANPDPPLPQLGFLAPNSANSEPRPTDQPVARAQVADDESASANAAADEISDEQALHPLQQTIDSIAFENYHVAGVLAFLSQRTGAEFLLDLRAVGGPSAERLVDTIEPPKVPDDRVDGMLAEVNIHDTPLLEALNLMAAELGLQVAWEPGVLWISAPAAIRRDVPRYPQEQFEADGNAAKMEKPITLVFKNIHATEVTDFVTDTHEVNIAWDGRYFRPKDAADTHPALPDGKVTRGHVPFINLKGVTVRDALRVILRGLNLDYHAQSHYLWISDRESVNRDRLISSRIFEPEWDDILSKKVGLVFEDIGVYDILDFIQDTYNAPIVVDQRVIVWKEEPAHAVSLLRGGAGGFVRNPVTHGVLHRVYMRDCPGSVILHAALRQLDLNYKVNDDGAVVISSPKLLNAGDPPAEWLKSPEETMALVKALEASHEAEVEPESNTGSEPSPADQSAESNATTQPPVLLRIWTGRSDGNTAHIQTATRAGWYEEGEAFERYRLLEIQPDIGCVTLLDEVSNETLQLCLDQGHTPNAAP